MTGAATSNATLRQMIREMAAGYASTPMRAIAAAYPQGLPPLVPAGPHSLIGHDPGRP